MDRIRRKDREGSIGTRIGKLKELFDVGFQKVLILFYKLHTLQQTASTAPSEHLHPLLDGNVSLYYSLP